MTDVSSSIPAARALSRSRLRALRGHGVTVTFASLLAIQVVNALTGILLARTLGPTGRGELAAVLLWPFLFATLGELSLSDGITYFTARRRTPDATLIGTAFALLAVQSIVLVGLGLVLEPLILSRHGAHVVHLALLLLAAVPANLVCVVSVGYLNGRERFRLSQLLRFLVTLTTAVALVCFALTGDLTLTTAALSYLLGTAIAALGALGAVAASVRQRIQVSRGVARELLVFGLKSHTTTVSGLANERLDQLVMSVALAPAQLGLYVAAVNLASSTLVVGSAFATIALPAIARTATRRGQLATIRKYTAGSVALAAVLTVPLIVLTPFLIRLVFGSKFLGASTSARVLLVAALALSASRVLGASLSGLGKPLQAGNAQLIALVVTVAGLAALLPLMGIVGAAITSLLAYLVSGAWMLRRVARETGGSVADFVRFRPLPEGTRP